MWAGKMISEWALRLGEGEESGGGEWLRKGEG
jgi:hypothetical protein